MMQSSFFKSTVNKFLLAVMAAGVMLRLYQITANQFLFYDEGMYVGQNRAFLDLVAANPPKDFREFWIILGLMFKTALASPKSLWFFLLDVRVFFLGPDSWYFSRLVSAVSGIATVFLTCRWAARHYNSAEVGWVSAAILCVLPSHVFYARLGMQEALSAFLFLAGMYLYVFSPRGVSWRSQCAAVLLAAVFFTNYRMIIAPLFPFLASILTAVQERRAFDARKAVWFGLLFLGLVFGLGALYNGANTYVTFGWMFHQADESHAYRHWLNFFSFPYYLWALEGGLFGILFWLQFLMAGRVRVCFFMPAAIVLTQMLLFSFAAEKGARYLCVVLPFAAMGVGAFLVSVREHFPGGRPYYGWALGILMASLIWPSIQTVRAHTDYGRAVAMVQAHDPDGKMLSTQPLVEALYVQDPARVVACPRDPRELALFLRGGYRYLLLDPQAYVSWTEDGERFSRPLVGYLEFLQRQAQPVAVLPHMEGPLLRRFVLDHNQDLRRSLEFLKDTRGAGKIYIYDLKP